jgi:transposase
VVEEVLVGQVTHGAAAAVLDVSKRTVRRYLHRYRHAGAEGLRDRRGGPRPRLSAAQEAAIVAAKRAGPHRSARKIRNLLQLPVSREAVRQVLVRHGLARLGLPPVKPVQRFAAAAPNALWQLDIMGKVRFPLIGDLYLILALDDHSRFILAGGFFPRKFRIYLFTVMHTAFTRWGLPAALLSDRESHFKPTGPTGEADYQYYARRLGIQPVYARRARTKGKIERLFQFIQRDFVLEYLESTAVGAVNTTFAEWMEAYNFGHESRALDWEAPAARYVPSLRRLRPEELELLLVHEEPRKVARTGTISYYGRPYRVPDAYIGRRVWTRLKGDRLTIQVGRTTVAEYTLDYEPRT